MATKIYLAASFASRPLMRDIRSFLTNQGYEITSRWIDQEFDGIDHVERDVARSSHAAWTDAMDIGRSDMVAVFTDVPSTTGGLHVELGMALGLKKYVYLIGPRSVVFHVMPGIHHFQTVDKFLSHMDRRVTVSATEARASQAQGILQ